MSVSRTLLELSITRSAPLRWPWSARPQLARPMTYDVLCWPLCELWPTVRLTNTSETSAAPKEHRYRGGPVTTTATTTAAEQLCALPISAITIRVRSRRELRNIEALAASIEAVGLLNPPTVRRVEDQWVLIAGERRLTAMEQLGWVTTCAASVEHPHFRRLSGLLAPLPVPGTGRTHGADCGQR